MAFKSEKSNKNIDLMKALKQKLAANCKQRKRIQSLWTSHPAQARDIIKFQRLSILRTICREIDSYNEYIQVNTQGSFLFCRFACNRVEKIIIIKNQDCSDIQKARKKNFNAIVCCCIASGMKIDRNYIVILGFQNQMLQVKKLIWDCICEVALLEYTLFPYFSQHQSYIQIITFIDSIGVASLNIPHWNGGKWFTEL